MKLPPLTSANWWPLAKAVDYVEAKVGDAHIGRRDFVAAVNAGDVSCKIEQDNQRTGNRATIRLSAKLRRRYEFARLGNVWLLKPRAADVRPIMPRYVMLFWSPHLKKIWPPDDARDAVPNDAPSPRRRPGPQPPHEWQVPVAAEVIRRVKAGERAPTAPQMLQWCADRWEWEPHPRQMQKLLKALLR